MKSRGCRPKGGRTTGPVDQRLEQRRIVARRRAAESRRRRRSSSLIKCAAASPAGSRHSRAAPGLGIAARQRLGGLDMGGDEVARGCVARRERLTAQRRERRAERGDERAEPRASAGLVPAPRRGRRRPAPAAGRAARSHSSRRAERAAGLGRKAAGGERMLQQREQRHRRQLLGHRVEQRGAGRCRAACGSSGSRRNRRSRCPSAAARPRRGGRGRGRA